MSKGLIQSWLSKDLPGRVVDVVGEAVEAAVAEQARPQLHRDYAEDGEDEDAEEHDVAEHGQGVDEDGDEDAHALISVRRV